MSKMTKIRNNTRKKNKVRDNVSNGSKTNGSPDEEDEFFEACILNCAYAEYQVDTEVKTYSPKLTKKKQLDKPTDGHSMIQDVVLSVSSNDSSTFGDDKSLLDLDSSSSLSDFEESPHVDGSTFGAETRQED